ncbi:MAG: hypothetical protein A3B68_03595 [Candidatus Melainabacteria bacterium RIFCSPHIGHO2_02_FULL_34_12]|nr:MAG: hypothetical protein A3B68_03595 [Candidatus Melainabacteria bacterium RIFCSPHIGHO2_02_FULL_34_12]
MSFEIYLKENYKKSTTILVFLILVIYFFIATHGTLKFGQAVYAYSYYNVLASGFAQGKIEMPYPVPKGLLALKNPYDPIDNFPFRNSGYQDLSLYKNKLYLYFGPTPVVVLYLPLFYFFSGYNLPAGLANFIFMSGTLIFAVLLISYLRKIYFKNVPVWLEFFVILVLAFANMAPFLIYIPAIYQIAIACDCFFLTGAVYFLCRAANKESLNYLFLGSLFLGLSVGARFYFLSSAIILIAFFCAVVLRQKNRFTFLKLLSLIGPFLFCLMMLMFYNYIRFENIFETGNHYQLTGFLSRAGIENIIPNLYTYLLNPVTVNCQFPYLSLHQWHPRTYIREAVEKFAGLFYGVPFILISSLLFFKNDILNTQTQNHEKTPFPFTEFIIISIPAFINFVSLLAYQYVNMRYLADFLTLWLLLNIIVLFYFDSSLSNGNRFKTYIRFSGILSGLLSIIFGIGFMFRIYGN